MRSAIENRRCLLETIVSFVSLSLLLATFAGCQKTAAEPTAQRHKILRRVEVTVAKAARMDIATPVEFVGNLLPRRRTMLVAQVDGVIRSIPASGAKIDVVVDGKRYTEQLGVVPGQQVREGESLIELDPIDYELALATAQSKLARTQAELQKLLAGQRTEDIQKLRAVCAEFRARHSLAVSEFDRVKELLQTRAISRSEYDSRATEVETAKAILAGAEASLQAAEAGPTQEEIAVAKATVAQEEAEVRVTAEKLSKATIRAPYDGVVTDIYVDEGDRVSAAGGSQLLEIMDLRFLIAEVGVPEAYLGKVRVEDRATMTVAGQAEPIPAIVVSINGKVEPDSRTFRVRVAIDNSGGLFKAGQFALVHFSVSGSQQAMVVPSRAIIFKEGQPHVYVCRDQRVQQRSVVVGVESDTHSEIVSGLKPGEQVVVDDPSLLTDGMPVAVRAPDPALASREPVSHRGAL